MDLGALNVAQEKINPFESTLAHQSVDADLPVLVPAAVALPNQCDLGVVLATGCGVQDGARLNAIELQISASNLEVRRIRLDKYQTRRGYRMFRP